jgi:nucleoid-associated protein EbfC
MDMRALMKQAQQMQAKMAKAQAELEDKEVATEVAGGQIKIVMNGKHRIKSLEIAPEAMDPDDIEFLQDLLISAVNDAVTKVETMVEKDMGAVTGGMNIPGMPGM